MSTPRAHGFLRLSSRDAVARLQALVALEELSPLSSAKALVVDLDGASQANLADLVGAAAALRRLPCPSIGVGHVSGHAVDHEAAPLLEAFDLLVLEEQLPAILASIARCPIASMALVQLLRLGDALDLHDALIAESLVYSTLQSGPEFKTWTANRRPVEPSADSSPAVLSTRKGDRLEIVLNRPERRNAYSVEMRDALTEALEVAVADPSVGEIVMRARGPSFSAGGDLAEFGTLPDPATAHAIRSTRSAARLLARCADRVRVEVHGACVGAGVELPAFASSVAAREDAFFELPELAMGLVPGAGGTASIPQRIGRQRTAYMALSCARVDVHTAFSWGLVDEIVK